MKLNVKEFAEITGYSRPYVSMVEHGKIEASEEFLNRVCEFAGVPMGWLTGEDRSAGDRVVGDRPAGENPGEGVDESDDALTDDDLTDDTLTNDALSNDVILATAFQYTEEKRKEIRDRNLSEVKHPNGYPSAYGYPSDLETLTNEGRIKHQEMMEARAERFRQLRKEHGHSIRQCAAIVPLSTATVILVEGGKREMTKALAKKLGAAYDVSDKWLLYGDEDSKDWPIGDKMIGYLERHPEVRKYVWDKMMEEMAMANSAESSSESGEDGE